MPSSFARSHSRALGFSPRLRVSVSGTVADALKLRGFSRQCGVDRFAGAEAPTRAAPHPPGRDFPRPIDGLEAPSGTTSRRWTYPPASPHRTRRRLGNVDPIPVSYASRPRIRGRLTPSRRTFLGKPWAFGGRDSHPAFRYSSPHTRFSTLHRSLRYGFTASRTLPYCSHSPAGLREPAASVRGLSPDVFSAQARVDQ